MIRLVSAWVLVNGLLMTPVWLTSAVTDAPAPAWLSLEAAWIVGAMALLRTVFMPPQSDLSPIL